MGTKLSRRRMLGMSLTFGAGALAVACGPNAPAAPTQPPAKPTEAPKPTAAAATPAPKPTAAPAAGGSPTPAAKPAATKNVTLNLINHVAYGPDMDKQVFPVSYDIFRQKTGISISETILPEDQQYPVKMLTMVAGGTAPDVAFIHPQWISQMAAKGAILPVDSYMKDPEVDAGDLFTGALTYYQFPHGAKTYGIPHYSGPIATIFNRTLFKQAGVPAPDETPKDKWTWQAALETALKMTKGSGPDKQFGWDSLTSGLHHLNALIWSFGGEEWDKDMTKCLLDQPATLDALQFYGDFEWKHKVTPSAAEAQGVTSGKSGRIISGRVAMKWAIKGDVPEIADFAQQKNVEIGMCPIPMGVAGRFVRNGPNSFCLIKGSKNPDEVFKLMNFMSFDDFQALQYKVGASIPPRKSQFDSEAFRKSLRPWEKFDVWKEAAELDKPLPMSAMHIDIQNLFTPAWDLIHLGTKTAKEAITPIVPKINDLLAKAKTVS